MSAVSERRDEVEAITGRLYNRKWTDRPPAADVESLLNRLLTSLEAAEERLELAKQALVGTGHFTADEVGDDVAPRITELWSTRLAAPGRWWRVLGSDGALWCETSVESEARDAVRTGDKLQRLWESLLCEWRDVD